MKQGEPGYDAEILRKLGFHDAGGSVGSTFQNVGGIVVGPDYNCFCASDASNLPELDLTAPQACFRIDDLDAFVRAVRRACPRFLAAFVARVVYGTRNLDPQALPDEPDPFLKPASYSLEQEIRMLCRLASGYEPATVIVPANHGLAEVMVRIA